MPTVFSPYLLYSQLDNKRYSLAQSSPDFNQSLINASSKSESFSFLFLLHHCPLPYANFHYCPTDSEILLLVIDFEFCRERDWRLLDVHMRRRANAQFKYVNSSPINPNDLPFYVLRKEETMLIIWGHITHRMEYNVMFLHTETDVPSTP
jgi:hypothetical protein